MFIYRKHFWLFWVIVVYIFISFQSIQAPFFDLDDQQQIDYLRQTESIADLLEKDFYGFFRPVKNILFLLFLDLLPAGMHAVRVLAVVIGIFTISSVYFFTLKLTKSSTKSFLTTSFWALSPTLVSSTAWLSCVNIMLMTGLACSLSAIHLIYKESAFSLKVKIFCLTSISILLPLTLLSYEGAVSIIPILFLLDLTDKKNSLRVRRNVPIYAVYIVIGALYLFLRLSARSMELMGSFSGTSRSQAAFASAWFTLQHLGTWIWPFNRFAVIGSYTQGSTPISFLSLSWALIILLLLSVVYFWKKKPLISLGIGWFLLGFAPMSNLAGFRNGPWGDYYLTLASIGLALVFSELFHDFMAYPLLKRKQLVVLACAILISSRAVESVRWSAIWNEPVDVWVESSHTFPKAFDIHVYLARTQLRQNNLDAAYDHARIAQNLGPDRHEINATLAGITLRRGEFEDARYYTNILLNHSHDKIWPLGFLGFLAEEIDQDIPEATRLYALSVSEEPWTMDSIFPANRLAVLYAENSETQKAIELWEKITQIRPDHITAHKNLSFAFRHIGDIENSDYHRNRAILLER